MIHSQDRQHSFLMLTIESSNCGPTVCFEGDEFDRIDAYGDARVNSFDSGDQANKAHVAAQLAILKLKEFF